MTKPEEVPQWAWDQAESALDTMLANHGHEGWRADSISTISKAILSAVEEEREQCAKEADKWNRRDVAAEIAFAIRNRKES